MDTEVKTKAQQALKKLVFYIEQEHYQGYDPYDGLNSVIPFSKMGKWAPILLMQLLKRLPFNIRPLLGIKKGNNPKAMGLFLHAYSLWYAFDKSGEIRAKMEYLFNWLKENYTDGYSGYAWGYNFDWAGINKMVKAYVPSAVVTGFICRGIYEYYLRTGNEEAKNILLSAAKFIVKDLKYDKTEYGLCISYTPLIQDYCYNASLLAAEVLAISLTFQENNSYRKKVHDAIDFVIHFQQQSGVWNYSIDLLSGNERQQIDFHQGYIIESIYRLCNLLSIPLDNYKSVLSKGMDFYYKKQFFNSGQAKWRIPKIWPVEIHNQAQGIITFKLMSLLFPEYEDFSFKITDWTMTNMQHKKGYFFYRIYKSHTNKIPFMRWSQAWMMLALVTLLYEKNK